MVQKINWIRKKLGSRKFRSPKILEHKKLWVQNCWNSEITGSKKYWATKILGSGKFWVMNHEKFQVMKNFGSWKIVDHEKSPVKFLVQKNIMSDKIFDPKKSWILKNFGTQNFLSFKNFELQKILSCKNILDQKKFGSE